MADCTIASTRGLEIVDRARKKKGWTRTMTPAWCQAAFVAQATLRRFWRRVPIQTDNFINICAAVGIANWEDIVDTNVIVEADTPLMPIIDWGEAPDISAFYGRKDELTQLREWLVTERCSMVALWGIGGIGKTSFAVTLVDNIQGEFEYIIWRSLRNAPTVEKILAEFIQFLLPTSSLTLPDSFDALLSQLMSYLRQKRCLLILDEFHTVFSSGNLSGQYREGYQGYGEILRRIGEERHQSCLVIASRELPKEIAFLSGEKPVRSLKLNGLDKENAKGIFKAKGFDESNNWNTIIDIYEGNPFYLNRVSPFIQNLFNNNLDDFLAEGTALVGEIYNLLEQQFNCLSDLEKQIMYYLSFKENWASFTQLREQLEEPVSRREFMEALDSLYRRGLMEKTTEIGQIPFKLQNIVKKYVKTYFTR